MSVKKRGCGVGPLTILVGTLLIGLFGLGRTDLSAADMPAAIPGSSEQADELTALLRRQERALFNSMTAGDMTDFPTIFYNDPAVPLGNGFKAAIDRVGADRINEVMAQLEPGPVGGSIGFLSAQIAVGIERQHELADLREGSSMPASPLSAADWVDVPFDVFAVRIQGDHATAKLAYGSREQSEVIDQFTFTHVQGRWYISGVRTLKNPNLVDQPPSSSKPSDRR